MKGFCPLASGSKGNSIYFGSENTRLLIDAGLSAKSLISRLQEIDVRIQEIEAILITHEHTDHIKGLLTLASRYDIPVFSNSETARAIIGIFGGGIKFKIFSTGEPFQFGDLEITPFSIQHDTLDPVAFTIHTQHHKVGFCTDLGFVTSTVKHHLTNCDFLYVEANHQPSMVHASPRPMVYKQRVLSRQGHLSNDECADLLLAVGHTKLQHVHLAHLSQECNNPELALKIVQEALQTRGFLSKVSIAQQDSISLKILF